MNWEADVGCDIHTYLERYQRARGSSRPCWGKLGPTPEVAPDPIPEPPWDPRLSDEENLANREAYDNPPYAHDYFPDDDGNDILADRNYGWFGFLADVRNLSASPYVSAPRGLPFDLSDGMSKVVHHWDRFFPGVAHSHSSLLVQELLQYDYSTSFMDARAGHFVRLCDFLGSAFFWRLENLRSYGSPYDLRLVFFFDC